MPPLLPRFGLLLVGLALLVAPGCDSGADVLTIGGTYRGTVVVGGFGSVAFRLSIPQTETGASFRYSGEATLTGEPPEAFAGAGTYAHPTVTMTDEDAPSDVIRGTVSADGDQITLVDPDSQQSIVLTR